MKKLSFIIATGLSFILLFAISSSAQNETVHKPLIIQTCYINAGNFRINLDSLLKVWKEKVMDANPYFTNNKIVRHWWGHDSREVVFISELKSWNDIEKAGEKQQEILKKHEGFTDAEAQKFKKEWFSVFTPFHHSDEIYQVVAE